MDVTNMPSETLHLLHKLTTTYPQFTFVPAESFYWSSEVATIYYDATTDIVNIPKLLHELSHALLGHVDFILDIELIQMERDAWAFAQTLASNYSLTISTEVIEQALESYRDWIHKRSICPSCSSNGVQTKTGPYKCFACGDQWRANDARVCELRRFKLQN